MLCASKPMVSEVRVLGRSRLFDGSFHKALVRSEVCRPARGGELWDSVGHEPGHHGRSAGPSRIEPSLRQQSHPKQIDIEVFVFKMRNRKRKK